MNRCLVLNANYEYLAVLDRWIDALALVLLHLALTNGAIVLFNLLPGFPLVGGRALWAVIAFLTFSQTVSADGSLTDVYAKGYQLAQQTYQQGAQVLNEAAGNQPAPAGQESLPGTSEVNRR